MYILLNSISKTNTTPYYSFLKKIRLIKVDYKFKPMSFCLLSLCSFIVSNVSIFTVALNIKRMKKKVKKNFALFYLLMQKKRRLGKTHRRS